MGKHVMTEDIGGEDFAEGWLWWGCVGGQLGFGEEADMVEEI